MRRPAGLWLVWMVAAAVAGWTTAQAETIPRGSVSDWVFFAFDRSDLDSTAQATLRAQAAWMVEHTEETYTIEGRADGRGTRDYNLALGARRAETVRAFLTALGVPPGRIKAVSYGKDDPVVLDPTEAGWVWNRTTRTRIHGAGR
jgi:peptidoglycan-associated lipoprotein